METFDNSKPLTIEEIREKRNRGEKISPEDYLRLKEHDMQEDRDDKKNLYIKKPLPKTQKKEFQLKGYDKYK